MTFTKDQLQSLYEAEIHFKTALQGYIKYVPKPLTLNVLHIYEEATGLKYNLNSSCSSCVLRLYQIVGKIYYADLPELEAKNKKRSGKKASKKDNKV